ncbi:MAG: class I adenylate-forming enzyme family protein, partial [Thermoanaerobaculia bacterium]
QTSFVMTRRALLDRAGALATEFAAYGLSSRDAIAIQLPNGPEFVAAVLAACRTDLVIVPIDRDAPETEVAAILAHFAIKGLVYRPDRNSDVTAVSIRSVAEGPAVPANARLLKLTSGSSGLPKAIVTSEGNLAADCRNICATMGIAPDDLNLGAIPFSHSYGFSNLVTPLLLQGTPVVASNDYMPQSIIGLANRHHCTVLPLIPLVFEHLSTTAHGTFESARTFISAGAPLMASTSHRFGERFGTPIHSFYGCSECGGITFDRTGGAVQRGSVGEPMIGVEVSTEHGRLFVRGEAVAAGYLKDASTFQPFEDAVYRTDDLVEMAAGEVCLRGRFSDLINTAGKKVNPREVELVIAQIEGVRQVKVFGQPAGARGEVVAAAIVGTPDVTREKVREFCRTRLSLHKVPRIVKLIDAIPVDERGKVRRSALAEL